MFVVVIRFVAHRGFGVPAGSIAFHGARGGGRGPARGRRRCCGRRCRAAPNGAHELLLQRRKELQTPNGFVVVPYGAGTVMMKDWRFRLFCLAASWHVSTVSNIIAKPRLLRASY